MATAIEIPSLVSFFVILVLFSFYLSNFVKEEISEANDSCKQKRVRLDSDEMHCITSLVLTASI
jgi:hypothetical protein